MRNLSNKVSTGGYHQAVDCLKTEDTHALRPSIWSSVLMAIGGMGDALLYAYLPVKGEALGMTLFSIGWLLSINKFTRFFSNRWMAWLAHKWGIKMVLLLGVVLSSITTLVYALNPAVWIWMAARCIWGAAYSALRFATVQYADHSKTPGRALGIGRSIQETGPLVIYWIGPAMLSAWGAGITFTLWALLLLALLPIFYLLPALYSVRQDIQPFSFQKPQWIDVWVFFSAFGAEGLLIVGISRLVDLTVVNPNELVWIAAIYLSVRRVLTILISPLSGWLADRFGGNRVFRLSCALIGAGFMGLAAGFNETGILLTFMGAAANYTLAPLLAMQSAAVQERFNALTRISTSRDLGSAVGSLACLSLFSAFDPALIFAALCLIITGIGWRTIKRYPSHAKGYSSVSSYVCKSQKSKIKSQALHGGRRKN